MKIAARWPTRGSGGYYPVSYLPRTSIPFWWNSTYELSETLSSYWASFIKNGDPNGRDLPTWPTFDEKAANPVLYLDTQIQTGPVPNKAGLEFYEAFYNSLRASVK